MSAESPARADDIDRARRLGLARESAVQTYFGRGAETMGDESVAKAGEREGAAAGRPERAAPDERLREMVDLIERVRHEMNNPLTGIIGQAQLLLRDETLGAPARKRIEAIEQLAQRLRDAVAQLRVVQTPNGPANTYHPDTHDESPPRTTDESPRQ